MSEWPKAANKEVNVRVQLTRVAFTLLLVLVLVFFWWLSNQGRSWLTQLLRLSRSSLTRQPLTTSRRTRKSKWKHSWALLEARWDFSRDSQSSAVSRSSTFWQKPFSELFPWILREKLNPELSIPFCTNVNVLENRFICCVCLVWNVPNFEIKYSF